MVAHILCRTSPAPPRPIAAVNRRRWGKASCSARQERCKPCLPSLSHHRCRQVLFGQSLVCSVTQQRRMPLSPAWCLLGSVVRCSATWKVEIYVAGIVCWFSAVQGCGGRRLLVLRCAGLWPLWTGSRVADVLQLLTLQTSRVKLSRTFI